MKKSGKRRVKKFLKGVRQKDDQVAKSLPTDAKASLSRRELSVRKRGLGERTRAVERQYPAERVYPDRIYPEDRMYPVDKTTRRLYPGEREYPAGRPYPEMRKYPGVRPERRRGK